MDKYLIDTEFAITTLIDAIYSEKRKIADINKSLDHFNILRADFMNADSNDDYCDAQVQYKFIKMTKMGSIINRTIGSFINKFYLPIINPTEIVNDN